MIAVNSKPNITFKGMAEDVAVSRQIVRNIRTEFGRPHSYTFLDAKILQHKDNPKYHNIIEKLEIVKKKYFEQVEKCRSKFMQWYVPNRKTVELPECVNKRRELVHMHNAANCDEMGEFSQYDHLIKGIEAHNIGFNIVGQPPRDHFFTLRNLPKNADYKNPKTWGEAILVDSWTGSGIVGQAVMPEGSGKKGALKELLEYFCFNPKKESIRFFNHDSDEAVRYIEKMKKQAS